MTFPNPMPGDSAQLTTWKRRPFLKSNPSATYGVVSILLTIARRATRKSGHGQSFEIIDPGWWYHVMSRGNHRENLFRDDDDRRRLLGLLSEWPERFRIEIHAFILMDNHYHLLARTPEPNLNHGVRWLNVSYSSRFNWAHQQIGHVFAGRYRAVVIQDERGVCEVARYVHLNPVRIEGLGLGKAEQRGPGCWGARIPGRPWWRSGWRCCTDTSGVRGGSIGGGSQTGVAGDGSGWRRLRRRQSGGATDGFAGVYGDAGAGGAHGESLGKAEGRAGPGR